MLKTRHYVLIAVIVVLGVYNFVHMRARKQATAPPPMNVEVGAPRSPQAETAWAAYDHAASLRDANTDAFHPALEAFDAVKSKVAATPGTDDAHSLDACRIWLVEYRSSSNGSMHDLAVKHVGSCVQLHRDVSQ